MDKSEMIQSVKNLLDENLSMEHEIGALRIEKGETRARIERLEEVLASRKKDVEHLYLDLQNKGDHVNKLLAQITRLEKENAVQGQNLSAYAKDLTDALDAIRKREERIEKFQAYIKALESRPTLAQQGRVLEDLNMLQARFNASEERFRVIRAENEKLKDNLFKARDERDEYMTRASADLMLREEVEKKLEFWKGWGIVIGMMIANVIWLISKEIF